MINLNQLFEKAQIRERMHIADFGCGRTGNLVLPALKLVGEQGMVFAVDILKDDLYDLEKRAHDAGVHNLHTIWANLEYPGTVSIPAHSLDVVFIINTLVQTYNRHAVLSEAKRVLKDKGRIIVVDWIKKGLTFGPKDERFVDFENIKRWAIMNHFVVQEEFAAGPYHKGIVFYKHP